MIHFFATFTWDPDRNFFIIPYIDHPVTWYGFLFALGFAVGYSLIRKMFKKLLLIGRSSLEIEAATDRLSDRITGSAIVGSLIGARLGHVFFYEWPYYKMHPLSILKIWEGGLASHGAAVGILLALIFFVLWNRPSFKELTFLTVLDLIVVTTPFVGGCIRIGNFINQEITGIPTSLPWGITFLHPIDGIAGVPVHPVQLYESFFYFFTFALLWWVWKRHSESVGRGLLSGIFFILVFGFRFGIELLKMPQNLLFDQATGLKMGQLLSLPMILAGFALLLFYMRSRRHISVSPS